MSRLRRDGTAEPVSRDQIPGANADREIFIFSDVQSRITIEEGRGYNNFVPVLGGDGTKIAPPRDLFDQPLGERSCIRGKLADHIEDPVALSPEGVILVTSPGTESSYPRPPPIVETLFQLTTSRIGNLTRLIHTLLAICVTVP